MAFLEDYTLLDELGQGGYATVYKVRHNELGYIRAIRVLNAVIANGDTDPTYRKFLEECRLLLRLGNGNHPNIVHIYQPLLRNQRAIVEMDYVKGEDLYKYLARNSSFVEADDVMKLVGDISSALAYCHEDIYQYCMNIDDDNLQVDPDDATKFLIDDATHKRLVEKYRVIHNDIHSGNIIRRDDGNYVILDFGLAIEGNSVVRSSRRRNGAPEFKAPEKWDNDMMLSTESDIYSFGVVMYEYLAGRVPFVFDKSNTNPTEAEYLLSKAHKEETPAPIYELRKAAFEKAHPGQKYVRDYPQWLENVIMKCLAKRPEDRFRNGKELNDEIKRNLSLTKSKGGGAVDNREIYAQLIEDRQASEKQIERMRLDNNALHNRLLSMEEDIDNARGREKEYRRIIDELKEKQGSSGSGWIWVFVIISIGLAAGLIYFANSQSETQANLQYEQYKFDSLQNILDQGTGVKELRNQIEAKNKTIQDLQERVGALNTQVKDLNNNIESGNEEGIINSLKDQISSYETQVADDQQKISKLEEEVRNAKISGVNASDVSDLNAQITQLESQISQKQKEITRLKNELQTVQRHLGIIN